MTELWQVASGKWQVASGKWQVASFLGLWLIVKQKLKINDGCHCEEALADAAIQKDNYLAKAGLLRLRLAMTTSLQSAFTLVELSIVLVIIGLIVGGVLVGQDLINAATIRAQISQIEKYNTAVHTFQLKYGYLPGDIPDPAASAFGFAQRGQYQGQGDGNGFIAGSGSAGNNVAYGWLSTTGETGMFWVDLSKAGLISDNFSTASIDTIPSVDTPSSYFPAAKIGGGNFIYVWSNLPTSGFPNISFIGTTVGNYFGISNVSSILGFYGRITSSATLSVLQAYNIDTKIDDGLPQTGNVIAVYINNDPQWVDGSDVLYNTLRTSPLPASATTCYDNGNVTGATMQYSTKKNKGTGQNCALSFKFQ